MNGSVLPCTVQVTRLALSEAEVQRMTNKFEGAGQETAFIVFRPQVIGTRHETVPGVPGSAGLEVLLSVFALTPGLPTRLLRGKKNWTRGGTSMSYMYDFVVTGDNTSCVLESVWSLLTTQRFSHLLQTCAHSASTVYAFWDPPDR